MNAWDVKREAAIPMWQARIKACRSSELNVKEWCAANGIDRRTYYKWESLCLARASQNAANETSLQADSQSMIRINHAQLPSVTETPSVSSLLFMMTRMLSTWPLILIPVSEILYQTPLPQIPKSSDNESTKIVS